MIVLAYIGDHKKDTLSVRLGWWLTRLVQTGEFKRVTHTESVLKGTNYKLCSIASSSARDGGVRVKENISLTKGNWLAIDVPTWDVWLAAEWFEKHKGEPYDWLGAIGSVLFFVISSANKAFCSQSTLAAFVKTPEQFSPSEAIAVALSMPGARDVTDEFFYDYSQQI